MDMGRFARQCESGELSKSLPLGIKDHCLITYLTNHVSEDWGHIPYHVYKWDVVKRQHITKAGIVVDDCSHLGRKFIVTSLYPL